MISVIPVRFYLFIDSNLFVGNILRLNYDLALFLFGFHLMKHFTFHSQSSSVYFIIYKKQEIMINLFEFSEFDIFSFFREVWSLREKFVLFFFLVWWASLRCFCHRCELSATLKDATRHGPYVSTVKLVYLLLCLNKNLMFPSLICFYTLNRYLETDASRDSNFLTYKLDI